METIGIYGEIATGKSKVAQILAKKGIPIIDADKLAHETYTRGAEGYSAVVEVFGEKILDPDGEINRKILGDLVFKDKNSLSKLTSIVWPFTKTRIINIQKDLEKGGAKIVVLEAAVLIEAGWKDLVSELWKVTASDENSIKRLMDRDNLTYEEALKRLKAHKVFDKSVPNVIIENNGSISDLERKVDEEFDKLISRIKS